MRTARVPEGLAAMPPGPGLAAALGAVEPALVPNDRILEILRAQYRQLSHEQARMAAVIAEVGRCEGYPEPGQVARLDAPGYHASEETRAALRWTRTSAECEHGLSEIIVHRMPAVFAAWLAGEIDRPRVRVFERYLLGLAPEQISNICRVAVPRAPMLTTGQLAVLLRRMVIAVDPEAAARWYRKGIRERNVSAHLGFDGTVTISANGLPADEAEAACVRLQDLAAAAKRAGHAGLIGQIRCDLFLGMLDGRFHHMTSEQVIAALIADYRETGPAAPPPAAPPPTAPPAPAPPPAAPPPAAPGDGGPVPAPGAGAGVPGGDAGTAAAQPSGAGAPVADEDAPDDDRSGRPVVSGAGRASCGAVAVRDERVGIEVRVALSTLLGRDEHPAEIPGLGLLPAPDARHRVTLQTRAEWRFALTDTTGRLVFDGRTRRRPRGARREGPPGGIVELHIPLTLLEELVAGGAQACGEWAELVADITDQHTRSHDHHTDLDSRPGARLPGAALRRHTEIRDRTCMFIGCRRRAHAAEQDHTHDHHHGGATVRANLGPLCEHDHAVKHDGGWRVEQPEPGTFIWRSPLGGIYHTAGESFLPPMPDPAPVELEPDFDDPSAPFEGPILHRPPPEPPRQRPPPPPQNDPDEPPPF